MSEPAHPAIRLVALDLDGTLLRSDKSIAPADAAAIAKARARGVKVVLASARPPRSVKALHRELGLDTPTINYNGAMIHIPDRDPCGQGRGVVLEHKPLPAAAAQEVVRVARACDPDVLVSVEVMDTWHTDRVDPALLTETARHFQPDHLGPLDAVLAAPVTKVMLLAPRERLDAVHDAVRSALGRRIAITYTDHHLIQIMHPGVDKAIALAWLAGRFDIPATQVLAVGDAPNDVRMLEFAGVGVAVGNAWPEAKAAADWVATAGNDEGAVAEALERFVLGG